MFNLNKFIADSVTFRPVSMFAADIEANKEVLTREIKGKKVCVIGGAGSIGSSFPSWILKLETWNQQPRCPESWNQRIRIMSKVRRFEDLTIFQMARDLCKEVYAISKDGEFHKDMRFVQQIHAAAGSIMDNIAEGYERDGNKEFINFLYIAKGSCGEVRSQIIRATDVGFIDKDTAKKLYNDSLNLSKAISKFITSLKGSPITGLKHLKPEG